MKTLCTIILFICMIAATFGNILIIAAYKINQQYISKTLCINKDRADMHCNGKCYLNKQLAKAEKPASPLNTRSSERFEVQFCGISAAEFTVHTIIIKSIYFNHTQIFTKQEFISLHLHPPQA